MPPRNLLTALAFAAMTFACASDDAPPSQSTTDATLMERGLQQLHQAGDPVSAEQTFREVLARTPTHYGARFQLAVAMDRGGRPTEARPVWQMVLQNAQQANDSATMRTAQARLAAPDTASVAATMVLGVDLLHRQNDPAAAAEQFRAVLRRNPTHYGATYQLATALDRSGRTGAARPLWEKVLGMATGYRDSTTAATARVRLAR